MTTRSARGEVEPFVVAVPKEVRKKSAPGDLLNSGIVIPGLDARAPYARSTS